MQLALGRRPRLTLALLAAGKVLGVAATGALVRVRRRRAEALAALRASEQRLRLLVQSAGALVFTADAGGRVQVEASAWQSYTGRAWDRADDGWGWLAALHPEDRERVRAAWCEALQRAAPVQVEFRLARARGGWGWLRARAAPVWGRDGRVREWAGAVSDVTGPRRARERRRLLAETSATLAESLELEATLERVARLAVPCEADWCTVRLFNAHGGSRRVVLAHRDPALEARARRLLGRSEPGVLSFGPEHVRQSGRAQCVEDFGARARAALAHAFPEVLGMFDEVCPLSLITVPLPTRQDGMLGALTLVTTQESGRRYGPADLAFAEELGRRCALALENALLYRRTQDAVRARDDFLAVASHELRTPLTSLHLTLAGLARRAREPEGEPFPPAVREGLAVLGRQSRRLQRLVEALLDVSRIAGGRLALHLEEVDLEAVVRSALERLADEGELARAGSPPVRLSAPGGPVVGRWDRFRLEQVVENLLSNALKYGRGRPVDVRLEVDATEARLTVEDRGIGIPPDVQRHIFGKFERGVSERHYGGLGLGLFVVHEVVRALGGGVAVRSAPEAGACFTVRLPLAGPAAHVGTPSAEWHPPAAREEASGAGAP